MTTDWEVGSLIQALVLAERQGVPDLIRELIMAQNSGAVRVTLDENGLTAHSSHVRAIEQYSADNDERLQKLLEISQNDPIVNGYLTLWENGSIPLERSLLLLSIELATRNAELYNQLLRSKAISTTPALEIEKAAQKLSESAQSFKWMSKGEEDEQTL